MEKNIYILELEISDFLNGNILSVNRHSLNLLINILFKMKKKNYMSVITGRIRIRLPKHKRPDPDPNNNPCFKGTVQEIGVGEGYTTPGHNLPHD